MKTWFSKHKRIASISALALLVLLVATGTLAGVLAYRKSLTTNEPSEDVTFNVYKINAQKLDNHDDIGVMIVDCDSRDSFKTLENVVITQREGEYVQGTGACHLTRMVSNNARVYFENVDISAYEKGSIHVSLYVNEPSYMGTHIYLELTSSGTFDQDELSWAIPSGALKAGWNELYLGIEDATKKGEPNLKNINYSRIYCLGSQIGLDVFVDAVYATDTAPSSLEVLQQDNALTATKKPGFLMDFDSLDGLQSTGTFGLTEAKGEYKEGTGAAYVLNPTLVWIRANLQPTDISAYANGKLSYWLYVHDVSTVKDGLVYLEISSAGMPDKQELSWSVPGDTLVSGWNQIVFSIPGGRVTTDGGADLTKINYVRMYGLDCSEDAMLILDGLQLLPMTTIVPENGMILNCDSMKGIIVTSANTNTVSITNKPGEFTEGSGALKCVGDKNARWTISFADAIDVSKYNEGGIHVSLYVSDTSKLETSLAIELSSSGKPDVDEYQWNISVAALQNGWNELELKFASASVKGTPNLGALNYMRIYGKVTGELTTILDDVRAINIEQAIKVPEDGMILNCDTVNKMTVSSDNTFSITKDAAEHKEGIGAFKSVGSKLVWWRVSLEDVVDVSKYKDGGIHVSLYVSDPSKIEKSVAIELSSGGKSDKNEYQWNIPVAKIAKGWNEFELKFADAGVTGTPDLSALNYMRIYGKVTGEITAILDDVRAIDIEQVILVPNNGMILNCDTTDKMQVVSDNTFSITEEADEHTEGTGAFKTVGSKTIRWSVVLEEWVDISQFKDEGIHASVYVSDPTKLTSSLCIEISSGGKNDVDEYQWRVSGLQAGWNELNLDFASAAVTGTPDLSAINYIRIYRESSEDIVMILDDFRATLIEEDDDGGEESSKLVINTCDVKNDDTQLDIETVNVKEGSGAAKRTDNNHNRYQCGVNKDLSAYAEGKLHFWFYVEDVSKLTNDLMTIMLTTDSGFTQRAVWYYPKSELTNGWNEVYIDLANPNDTKDGFDWSNISKVRISLSSAASADITTIVDDIYVTIEEESNDNQEQKLVINNCDVKNDDTQLDIETVNVKEGTGAAKRTDNNHNRYQYDIGDKDLSAYAAGKLHFWLYVEDVSKLTNNLMMIQLSSDSGFTKYAVWYYPKSELTNGWNEVYIDLETPNSTKEGFVWSNVDKIRISLSSNASAAVTTLVDDIYVTTTASNNDSQKQKVIINNCDVKNDDTQLDIETVNVKEGTGAAKRTDNNHNRYQCDMGDKDLSAYATGKLHFWFYVEDVSKLTNNLMTIQLSSDSGFTKYAVWYYPKSELTNGWNEVYIDLTNPNDTKEGFVWSNVDKIRISLSSNASAAITTLVDDIYVTTTASNTDIQKQKVIINNCDVKNDDTQLDIETVNVKEGSGAANRTDNNHNRYQCDMGDKDLSAYDDGKLHFWLYVEDVSKLTNDLLTIQFSSDSGFTKYAVWYYPKSELTNGWNEVYIDLATPNSTKEGFVWSNVDKIRISLSSNASAAVTTLVDDIYVVEK